MGNGIAHVFAQHGWDVVLVDVDADAVKRGLAVIEKNTEKQASKGVLTALERRELLARITTATSLDAAEHAEIVVEAATENPEVKFTLFHDLSRLTTPSAVLASNTSSISITELAKHTNNPGRVVRRDRS